jgi:hypothetical protein
MAEMGMAGGTTFHNESQYNLDETNESFSERKM